MILIQGCVCRTTDNPERKGIYRGSYNGRAKVEFEECDIPVREMFDKDKVFALLDDQPAPVKKATPCAPSLSDVLKDKINGMPLNSQGMAAPAVPVPGSQTRVGTGAKWDGGKPQFDLLEDGCPNAVLGIVQVMSWAVEVKGYVPHSWQTVPEAIRRYGAALRRHQSAKARGERYDKESGLLHDFHIATNAAFVAELEARVDLAKVGERSPFDYNKTLP